MDLIKKARELDDNDSEVFRILASIQTSLGEHVEAEINLERAVTLNPNDPKILCLKYEALIWKGRPSEAMRWLEAAKRRDLNMDQPWWRLLGRAKFELKDYKTAFQSLNRIRDFGLIDRACLAASFALANEIEEAKAAAANIVEVEPNFGIATFVKTQPYLSQDSREHLTLGLRAAELPEG